jgi:hypothetical protein
MSKDVRLQAYRLALVYGLLACLVGWKHEFVSDGLFANIYLNGLIIAVFLFGSGNACLGLARLRNEVLAFRALREVYQDAVDQRSGRVSDSGERLARCHRPGIVVGSPKLLGHVYDLALEELLRTRHVRISVATMQNLVQAVSERIAADRSLLVYITGMCVFLGLIGTFIGLMEMVGSVGGIIGGLASAGAQDDGAMMRLIHDLEAPLKGMATGFSSSLFGLFCSLVLGLAGRFVNSAALQVKDDFEGWLAGISQLENETGADVPPGSARSSDPVLLTELRRSGLAIEATAIAVRDLAARQADHAGALVRATAQTEAMATRYVQVARSLERIDGILTELAGQRAAIQDFTTVVAERLDKSLSRASSAGEARHGELLSALAGLSRSLEAGSGRVEAGLAQSATLARETLRRQDDALAEARREWKTVHGASRHLAASLALTVARAEDLARQALERVEPALNGLGESSTAAQAAAARIEEAVGRLLVLAGLQASGTADQAALLRRLADGHAGSIEVLSSLAATVQREPQALALALGTGLGELSRSVAALEQATERQAQVQAAAWSHELRSANGRLEQSVNAGFADLARSFEASFMAYAELLRRISATPPAGRPGPTATPESQETATP